MARVPGTHCNQANQTSSCRCKNSEDYTLRLLRSSTKKPKLDENTAKIHAEKRSVWRTVSRFKIFFHKDLPFHDKQLVVPRSVLALPYASSEDNSIRDLFCWPTVSRGCPPSLNHFKHVPRCTNVDLKL